MIRTLLILLFLLAGCSTSQEELMPVDPDASMLTLWRQRDSAGCARAVAPPAGWSGGAT